MSAATTIVMVRHASHGHVGRRLTGRTPGVPLSEIGRAEATRLAATFAGVALQAVFSSPVQRATETAGPIAEAAGVPLGVAEALNEIDFGEWTGACFSDLERDPRWRDWNDARAGGCPPGGEPMGVVEARVAAQFEGWRRDYPDGRVVAVSHADVIKAALCGVLGLSLDRHGAFDIDPASRSTMVVWEGGAKVLGLNERVPA